MRDALVEMGGKSQLMSFGTATLQVPLRIVVTHYQSFRAVTLVGDLVEDVAILTVTLSSNLVQPGTGRAVGRWRWSGCVSGGGVRGWLSSMGASGSRVCGCFSWASGR